MSSLDGNSTLSAFIDWSARKHDTLHVVSGANETGFPVPLDNYNGVTVGNSALNGDVFRQVAPLNNFQASLGEGRNFIDLIAPGTAIDVPEGGNNIDTVNGSSFAAPHVTGTVALLQEFADSQIAASTPKWDVDARRHQVMKAVLMNSADKIADTGDGNLLGMTRRF